MFSNKLVAGESFPDIQVGKAGGGELNIPALSVNLDWQMVVVYRGLHCPICIDYLSTLNELLPKFHSLGVDVVAISADSEEKAVTLIDKIKPNFDIGFDLTVEQMQTLGLYVSNPRSAQETDRPFAEPGLFVINNEKNVQIVDISNAPFARPDLNSMLMGLNFIRDPQNHYPIRGTHA